MERNYYLINEKEAKAAHNMMSFSEYKAGSKTAEYKGYVDQAYDLAAKIAESRPDCAERAYELADRYSKKMAEYFNKDSRLGCMIMSSDEDAVEKLEEKLDNLKSNQENMKSANKAIRMKDIKKGDILLKNMGYTEEQIKDLRTPDYCGRIGYPDYLLRNNNANIHRIEQRLRNLKAAKEKGTTEVVNQFFKVVENTKLMRLQLFFEGKPEQKVRDILKSNGFKWAPSQSAWQRQLTNNSRYALERVIEQLKLQEAP